MAQRSQGTRVPHGARVNAKDIENERDIAERKAIDSLARYKFPMFGYWAAMWVHLNRLCEEKKPSPFKSLVKAAREIGA